MSSLHCENLYGRQKERDIVEKEDTEGMSTYRSSSLGKSSDYWEVAVMLFLEHFIIITAAISMFVMLSKAARNRPSTILGYREVDSLFALS